MSETALSLQNSDSHQSSTDSRTLVRGLASKELVFSVVGPVGSGTSEVANALKDFLDKAGYRTEVIKARDVIEEWEEKHGRSIPESPKMDQTIALQNAGDAMRLATKDNAAVALRLIEQIRMLRAQQKGEPLERGKPVSPDDTRRAFILDSLRNPAEVALLRSVYQEAFCLVGIVCEEEIRSARLQDKYSDAGKMKIKQLMERDEHADEKHGQHVADTFHLADFFIDNTAKRFIDLPGGQRKSNPVWTVMEELGRLVDILEHSRVVRPRPNETAMFHAYGARMRSACLSRQVGAALMDRQGNIVATGTNEVPKAGGGLHGSVFIDFSDTDPIPDHDHRCIVHGRFCRNTREQNHIIDELMDRIDELRNSSDKGSMRKKIRKTRIGQLIEFSRAVHAEMEALLSAGRQGISPVGTRLFVTTFPCHSCARHIVAAGVDEVQFIEPYLKSRALPLHGDAITTTREGWTPPSLIKSNEIKDMAVSPQVLFRPFTGVAPRIYRRAFYKDRELKDNMSGDMLESFGPPEGMASPEALRVSYAQVEANLAASTEEASG